MPDQKEPEVPQSDSEAQSMTFTSMPSEFRTVSPLPQNLLVLSVMPATASRERWPHAEYELARQVRRELGADWEKRGAFTKALEQVCRRYVQKNGRPFTPKNLRESLRQWDAWQSSKARRQR